MPKKYDEIVKKLGFEPADYEPDLTKDDYPNPFTVLTGEEIMWLWKQGYLKNKPTE